MINYSYLEVELIMHSSMKTITNFLVYPYINPLVIIIIINQN